LKLQEIISAVQEYNPTADLEPIRKAYTFALESHKGQTRASGEPYITHVAEVAALATKLNLDVASIVAALLHDTVEDTTATLDELRISFGEEVVQLVDAVTKLNQMNFSSRAEEQAENFRKMLLAMANDLRVILIKLCDRMHNMRTLEFLSEARRTRIARETLEIYAPIANRLGINWMKSELEDLSFRFLKPEVYASIKQNVSKKKDERERYIRTVVELISREIKQNGITGEVTGRPKHFYSIYQKMEKQGLQFDELHDLIGFRIIVPSTMECYAALGAIHSAWRPVPGRFKDYIAMPKQNQYQSLHTTVVGPEGARVEIQIRTAEMHAIAERGVAAHWLYKEKVQGDGKRSKTSYELKWAKELVENQGTAGDALEFMAHVKEDLFPNEVFVFSPKGDLISLAAGSTPIDFAYAVHSEIGHRCSGARVNGQQVPLATRLRNGDTVEIITTKTQVPSKDWLNIVVSSKAKQRIRSWLKAQERDRSVAVGKELFSKDLRRVKLSLTAVTKDGSLDKVIESMGFKDLDSLMAEIGYGKITTNQVVTKLLPDEPDVEQKLAQQESELQKIFQRAAQAFRDRTGVKVNGLNDVVFRFAQCCEPLPGDELVGYVTRGRGVTIHSRECNQALSFDPQRLIPVSWDDTVKTERNISLNIVSVDRVGILALMTGAISDAGASIVGAQSNVTPERKAVSTFELRVESSRQLNNIIRALEGIEGVIRVERKRRKTARDGAGAAAGS